VGSVGRGEEKGMRRVALVLTAMALALVLASGVALAVNKVGTNGPDTLRGTNKADNLLGRSANDILLALAGNDNLLGGPGKDIVYGGDENRQSGGNKNMVGGSGNDSVIGGRGSDIVLGEEGNDLVADGPAREFATDNVSGGEGNDVVAAVNRPAFVDIVSCGGGFDRVIVDRKDVLAPDCEKVFFGLGSEDEFIASIPQSFFEGLHPQFFEFLPR
jgi:Ca2+-binding RTX toxin-like protein